MKDVTMSRNQPTALRKRLAARSWLLGCLIVGASPGCAQISPHRGARSDRTALTAQSSSHAAAPAQTTFASTQPASAAASSQVMPVSYNQAAGPYDQMASCQTANCPTDGAWASGGQCGPLSMAGNCPQLAPIESGPVPPYWNDQEYLYDGGDREPTVQVTQDWEVRGLDSQDTVAHYETLDGKLCVAASNRVPIYAPRFGAVRKVAAPILAARAVGAERMLDPTGAVVQQSRDLAGNVTLPIGARKQSTVKLIDGLHDRTRGVPAEKITPLVNLSNPQVAFQHLEGLGTAVRREDLEARLEESMLNARTWTNDESIAVMFAGVEAALLSDAKQVQDILVFETEPGKCSLRITKAASHSAASPGDVVSFSIRFDNIGNKPIGNLVILDSLTTRLEYIDGSQQCILSLANEGETEAQTGAGIKFSTSENEAGSTVLRWEADLPLASGDSGVISFRCRIR